MKKIHFLLFLSLIMAKLTVFANGDPVATQSAMTLSSTPVAIHVPEVQIIDEKVTFTPLGAYTEVVVRYLLHNHSGKKFTKLAYGFPIDYIGNRTGSDPTVPGWEGENNFGESMMEVGWRDYHIREVSFLLGDRQLQWQCSKDSVLIPSKKKIFGEYYFDFEPDSADAWSTKIDKKIIAEYGEEALYNSNPVMRRWYYTYLDIAAHSYAMLEVRYLVLNTHETALGHYNPPLNNYNPDYYDEYTLLYDFTPAAYWGNGHADRFTFVLDCSNVTLNHLEDTLSYSGKLLVKSGKKQTFEALNFDLAKAAPLKISFFDERIRHQDIDAILNHSLDNKCYSVKASGTDDKYPIANINDLDLSTTTVLRPDKEGNTHLTITFSKPTKMRGMIIYNGYTKSRETWLNNSRIGSARIMADYYFIYNYKDEDGTIQKDTEDFKNECLYCVKDYKPAPFTSEILAKNINQKCPSSFDWQTLTDNAIILSKGNVDDVPYFTEIRITIPVSAKGLKYDDLCLSEIIIVGE